MTERSKITFEKDTGGILNLHSVINSEDSQIEKDSVDFFVENVEQTEDITDNENPLDNAQDDPNKLST